MCGPLLQPVSQDDERIILTTQIRGKGSLSDTKLAAIKDFIKGADFKAAERVLLGAYAYPRSELFAAAERKLKTLFNAQAKEKRQALSDGQGHKRILQDIRFYSLEELIEYYCFCGGRSPSLGVVIPIEWLAIDR